MQRFLWKELEQKPVIYRRLKNLYCYVLGGSVGWLVRPILTPLQTSVGGEVANDKDKARMGSLLEIFKTASKACLASKKVVPALITGSSAQPA